ncbi:hypothetical protein RZS08_08805, partial [Arthrospira platensis SPKY1]|nr:hypothetical protein [Arthrospira platensis SPKY1]
MVVDARVDAPYLGMIAGGAQGDEQRQQVLLAWMSARRLGGLVAIVQHRGGVARRQTLAKPVGKAAHVGRCVGGAATRSEAEIGEVVGEVARTHDEDAARCQWRQAAPELPGGLRSAVALNGEWHDGD